MTSTTTASNGISSTDGGSKPNESQPGSMSAVMVTEFNGPIVVEHGVSIPDPGTNKLLVKITASSLCMSDVAGYVGHVGAPLPYCPGHEPVGVVTAVGTSVRGFRVGDRVGFMPASGTCGDCPECISGNHRYCSEKVSIGFNGPYGGFSEYCLADPASTAKIPEGLKDEHAAPLLCAGVTAYGALKKASHYQTGGTLINVIGVGGVGHLVVMYAKAMGFKVHAFDIAEDKLRLGKDCGADEVYNCLDAAAVTEKCAQSPSTIVVSGAQAAYDLGINLTRRRGRVIAIGVPPKPISLDVLGLILKEKSLITTNQGTKQELIEALEIADTAGIAPIVELKKGLEEVAQGYQDLMTGKVVGRYVYRFAK
jgi:propanol-preferring alcohol dehydrogenase